MAQNPTPSAGKPDSIDPADEQPAETSRGHVVRDGGNETLALPASAAGNVVVTDRRMGAVEPTANYDVKGGKVVKKSGFWGRGTGRWLLEYDRG